MFKYTEECNNNSNSLTTFFIKLLTDVEEQILGKIGQIDDDAPPTIYRNVISKIKTLPDGTDKEELEKFNEL
jgi:hypothetical protein